MMTLVRVQKVLLVMRPDTLGNGSRQKGRDSFVLYLDLQIFPAQRDVRDIFREPWPWRHMGREQLDPHTS